MVRSGPLSLRRGCVVPQVKRKLWYREWRKFKNGARKDNFELGHWVKATADPNAGT